MYDTQEILWYCDLLSIASFHKRPHHFSPSPERVPGFQRDYMLFESELGAELQGDRKTTLRIKGKLKTFHCAIFEIETFHKMLFFHFIFSSLNHLCYCIQYNN